MLWKSRRRREEELLVRMARAAAEGNSRAMINRALGSIGHQMPPEPDNTQYSIEAAQAVVATVMERAGSPPRSADGDDRFIGGLFLFVASNHISRIVGADFEMVSSAAVATLFLDTFLDTHRPADAGHLVHEVASAYNKVARENGEVLQAIGQNIAAWINNPNDAYLENLTGLFHLLRGNMV